MDLIKVFVSLPMRGLKDDEIITRQVKLFEKFKKAQSLGSLYEPQYYLINTVSSGNSIDFTLPGEAPRIKCLGESIKRMADADVVIFARGWRAARGCNVEFDVVRAYDLCWTDEDSLDDAIAKGIGK